MQGVEFAWRAHAAQEQWVARVDAKATVVFTVEGVVVAAVLASLSSATPSSSIIGWRLPVLWLGITLSAMAVITAFLVIFPQLGRGRDDLEPHFIYFGQLQHWNASILAERISELTDDEQIHQLATQLTRLSRINWRKYNFLRTAVSAALVGALLLLASFAWPR